MPATTLALLDAFTLKSRLKDLGVDVTDLKKKADLLKAAAEFGVDDVTYAREFPEEAAKLTESASDESPEASEVDEVFDHSDTPVVALDKPEPKILLRMNRANRRFETYGHTFTRESPILPVPESVAQLIMDTHEGFAIASPREAKEFYS